MAEAIARHWLANGGLGGSTELLAASAGVFAPDGVPPSPEAVNALADLGIKHTGSSRRLTADMIRQARIVFCMTAAHVAAARSLVNGDPDGQARILLLDPDGDVDDPIGRGQEAYDSLSRRFLELVPRRIQEVLAGE
jgi:protein-tyrosine-phosphatase